MCCVCLQMFTPVRHLFASLIDKNATFKKSNVPGHVLHVLLYSHLNKKNVPAKTYQSFNKSCKSFLDKFG